jgi:hypothetical protein
MLEELVPTIRHAPLSPSSNRPTLLFIYRLLLLEKKTSHLIIYFNQVFRGLGKKLVLQK